MHRNVDDILIYFKVSPRETVEKSLFRMESRKSLSGKWNHSLEPRFGTGDRAVAHIWRVNPRGPCFLGQDPPEPPEPANY